MINSNITIDNSSVSKVNAIVELYMGSTVVTCTCNDRLQDLVIERAGVDGKFFGFGITQKLSVNLIDLERTLTVEKGTTCLIAFGVDDIFEYPYPPFYVDEISRDENTNTISIVAYDKLYSAESHEISELGISSYTISEFAEACASTLGLNGVDIEGVDDYSFDNYYSQGANFDETETLRGALNAIAEATQTVYFINRAEKLIFKRLKNSNERVLTIKKENYVTLKSEESRKLTNLVSATELGNDLSAGMKAHKYGFGVVSVNDVTSEPHKVDIVTQATSGIMKSYGKNLISYPFIGETKTENGITFTDNGNGTITINGTATAQYVSFVLGNTLPLEDGVTYVFSGCNDKLIVGYVNEKGENAWARGPIKWSKDYTVSLVYIQVNNGETYNNVVWSPMIRRNTASEEFERYVGQEAVVDDTGVIEGFFSISPHMTLSVGNNARVDIEYYRQREEGATQYVRDNPFWENREDIGDLVDNALSGVYGVSITPFECAWDGNFLLEPADKVGFIAENDTILDTYILNDTIIFDGTLSENTIWIYTENEGETASNPTSLGEFLNKTTAKVDKINQRIEQIVANEEALSQRIQTPDQIVESIRKTISGEGVEDSEGNIIEGSQGVEGIKIEGKDFTFDTNGLTITDVNNTKVKTTITEEGMTVSDKEGNPLLQATINNEVQGVRAKDLHATTYLIIGENSRLEDYIYKDEITQTEQFRTGCFWIGD